MKQPLAIAICRLAKQRGHTVAFLPTAGIFEDLESVYLLGNIWSALADDFRTFCNFH